MAPPKKNTSRKVVTLPDDVVTRIETFRQSRNLSSESDAMRRLMEIGLGTLDTPMDLANRCENATLAGHPIAVIITELLDDHPLVHSLDINSDEVKVYLRTKDTIRLNKRTQKWTINGEDIIPF